MTSGCSFLERDIRGAIAEAAGSFPKAPDQSLPLLGTMSLSNAAAYFLRPGSGEMDPES